MRYFLLMQDTENVPTEVAQADRDHLLYLCEKAGRKRAAEEKRPKRKEKKEEDPNADPAYFAKERLPRQPYPRMEQKPRTVPQTPRDPRQHSSVQGREANS